MGRMSRVKKARLANLPNSRVSKAEVQDQKRKQARKRQRPEAVGGSKNDTSDAENCPPPKESATGNARTSQIADKKSPAPSKSNIFSISLPGDETGTVSLYESCDEIRMKITKHLSQTKTTNAAFLRDIARAAFPNASPPVSIPLKQLSDFQSQSGGTSGNTDMVYYASYVYFEKKRLSEGEGKSDHRLKMEDQWVRSGGMPRQHRFHV